MDLYYFLYNLVCDMNVFSHIKIPSHSTLNFCPMTEMDLIWLCYIGFFFYVSEFNFLTFTKASHTYNKVFHTYTNKRTHKHLITEELLRQRMPLTYL